VRLTRRDALAVLAGAGILGGGTGAALSRRTARNASDAPADLDALLDALVAVAEVVYPSEVEGVPTFVETYSLGRIDARDRYREGVRDATRTLDGYAREWREAPYAELDTGARDAVLREMGVDEADPDPAGVDPERVRFYVVNELQYALYTSPAGGRLVGIENPQGYPGGIESYQQGPEGGAE